MAGQKGKVPREDALRIQKNYSFLLDELEAKDLIDVMFSRGIFDHDCLDEIRNQVPNTRKARTEIFLDKLLFSGPNGYKVFLEALKTSYPHVIPILENTDVSSGFSNGKSDSISPWFDSIPEERKQTKLSEQELNRLVQSLGSGWESIALELGVTSVQIDRAKMSATSPHMQIFSVFSKWKQQQGGNAKLITFLNAMWFAKEKCSIDWDLVEKQVLSET